MIIESFERIQTPPTPNKKKKKEKEKDKEKERCDHNYDVFDDLFSFIYLFFYK